MRRAAFVVLVALGAACAASVELSHDAPASNAPEPVEAQAPEDASEPSTARDGGAGLSLERMFRRFRREPYALDDRSRWATRDERGKLTCPELELEDYPGEVVTYHRRVRVNAHFKERLRRFEAVVARVAEEIYGRAPARIVHYGVFNCRTIRRRKSRLSEHAFGNAIDVAEFRFDALPRAQRKEAGEAGKRFRVNVERHWDATTGFEARHALFLRTLVQQLERDRVFRGMIVPPAPGHHNHLHLDMGRWRYLRGDASLPLLAEE